MQIDNRKTLALMLAMAWGVASGQADNGIPNCPPTPNCVTSAPTADDEHHIPPLRYEGSAETAWDRLRKLLKSQERMVIVEDANSLIRAEATSRVLRFVDDVEFRLDPAKHQIQVRSASRVGYSDFGVNRRRVESLRDQLAKETGPASRR